MAAARPLVRRDELSRSAHVGHWLDPIYVADPAVIAGANVFICRFNDLRFNGSRGDSPVQSGMAGVTET